MVLQMLRRPAAVVNNKAGPMIVGSNVEVDLEVDIEILHGTSKLVKRIPFVPSSQYLMLQFQDRAGSS